MHEDHTLRLAVGQRLPQHPDPEIRAELMVPDGPGCGAFAPRPVLAGLLPYRCGRAPGHKMPHVAARDTASGEFLAEWDEDRSTDLTGGPPE